MRRIEMIKVMELNKIYWCDNCQLISIMLENGMCKSCGNPLKEIGFIDNKSKNTTGGSTKPGLCKCGGERASKGIDNYGRRRYRTQCYKCIYQSRLATKLGYCEKCGTVPEKKKDLHLDHIDGDRSNNKPSNLQTLCVNCHKDKTVENGDWRKKG
jgi:hypothetical protein